MKNEGGQRWDWMTCYDLESKEEISNLTDHWGCCCSAFPSG